MYNGISVKSIQIPLFLGLISVKFVCYHNSRPTAISCLQLVPVSKIINTAKQQREEENFSSFRCCLAVLIVLETGTSCRQEMAVGLLL